MGQEPVSYLRPHTPISGYWSGWVSPLFSLGEWNRNLFIPSAREEGPDKQASGSKDRARKPPTTQGRRICQWLCEGSVVFSLCVLYVQLSRSSRGPNPDSFTRMRLSTRQLEGSRLLWDPGALLWRKSMPCRGDHEHVRQSRCPWALLKAAGADRQRETQTDRPRAGQCAHLCAPQ